jgi:ketopantoate reductase
MRYTVYGAGAIGGTPGAHMVRGGESVLFVDKDVVGKQRPVGAFVNFSADYLESGLIHFAGRGAFWLGELDGSMTPRLHYLQRALGHWLRSGSHSLAGFRYPRAVT